MTSRAPRREHRLGLTPLSTLSTLGALALAASSAFAGTDMPGMDHGGHAGHGQPQAMPLAAAMPAAMPAAPSASAAAMPMAPMAGHDMGAMAGGDMQMQGGSAPADARDPHAYSGGYTLTTGPYAQSGPRQLRLGDEHAFGALRVNRLEHVSGRDAQSTAYEAMARFGRDYDALLIKAEGDIAGGKLQEARTELLWSHALATFWDRQLGVRFDHGADPGRQWLAFGFQGLAPYWFELDATAYLGAQGRTALRLGAEYELLLTQKLVLQPHAELNLYGRSDPQRGLGSGLADSKAGLLLRYEISRQFAPYVGVEWTRMHGETATLARSAGERRSDTRWVAGLKFWY